MSALKNLFHHHRYATSLAIRYLIIIITEYLYYNHGVLYTDIDYHVFSDGAKHEMIRRTSSKPGDCLFFIAEVPKIVDKLAGTIRQELGKRLDLIDKDRFEWIDNYRVITDSQKKVVCCHYPIPFYDGQYRLKHSGEPKTYMLYGHVHNTRDEVLMKKIIEMIGSTPYVPIAAEHERTIPCNMINCFCMRSDYEPLTLSEWIKLTGNQ